MNNEKIASMIKDIRKKSGLSQQKFAQKYNVTYQAVSKWENNKSIPDILILRQICDDYGIDINTLLQNRKFKKHFLKWLTILICFLILLLIIFITFKTNDEIQFKSLAPACQDFTLAGTLASTDNKTYIHIPSISYCKDDDNTEYISIKCSLYENQQDMQKEISSKTYNGKGKTLAEFLDNIEFKIDNYEKSCASYSKDSLYLLIEATTQSGKLNSYKVPLVLSDNCQDDTISTTS